MGLFLICEMVDRRALEARRAGVGKRIIDDAEWVWRGESGRGKRRIEVLRLAQMPPVIAEALHEIDLRRGPIGVFDRDRVGVLERRDDGLLVTDDVGDASVIALESVILLRGVVSVETVFQHGFNCVHAGDDGPSLDAGSERVIVIDAVETGGRVLNRNPGVAVADKIVVKLVPIGFGLDVGGIANLGVGEKIEALHVPVGPVPNILARICGDPFGGHERVDDVEGRALLALLVHEAQRIFIGGVGRPADFGVHVPIICAGAVAKTPSLIRRGTEALGKHPSFHVAPSAADLRVIILLLRAEIGRGLQALICAVSAKFASNEQFAFRLAHRLA